MATQIKTTTNKSGITIPAGVVIVAKIHFPEGTLESNEAGDFSGVISNMVTADLVPFANKLTYQNSLGMDSLGTIDEIPNSYSRSLSQADYALLAGNNALGVVRGWIKDFIESKVGVGNAIVVDLSVID